MEASRLPPSDKVARPMRRARWLTAAVTVAIALTGVGAMAQDAGDLAAVKARLDRIANDIARAESTASGAASELADADARLAEVEAIVNELAIELELQEGRVAVARAELDRLQAHAAAVQAAFEARAIALFKRSFGSDLDAFLSAGDIQEAIDRRTMLEHLNEADQATIEQVQAAQGAVLTQQEVLELEATRLEQVKAEQEVVLAQVREIRESKALAAANARARVVELGRQQENLEGEEERIKRLIAERAAPPPPSGPILSGPSVSGYIWPTCGRVTSEYGRRWGRLHAGLDIDDNRTSAIVAAKAGTVVFAGWSGGYGQLTLIDHGDGVVTAYAHQSAIAVGEGQRVGQGQRIGTIGTTGSSTGTHLHFETRVNGAAQNPRRFLPGGC